MKTLLLLLSLCVSCFAQTLPFIKIEDQFHDETDVASLGVLYMISQGQEYDPDDPMGLIQFTGWASIEFCYYDSLGNLIYSTPDIFHAEQLEDEGETNWMYIPPVEEPYWPVFDYQLIKIKVSYRYATDPPTQPDRIFERVVPVNYPV